MGSATQKGVKPVSIPRNCVMFPLAHRLTFGSYSEKKQRT